MDVECLHACYISEPAQFGDIRSFICAADDFLPWIRPQQIYPKPEYSIMDREIEDAMFFETLVDYHLGLKIVTSPTGNNLKSCEFWILGKGILTRLCEHRRRREYASSKLRPNYPVTHVISQVSTISIMNIHIYTDIAKSGILTLKRYDRLSGAGSYSNHVTSCWVHIARFPRCCSCWGLHLCRIWRCVNQEFVPVLPVALCCHKTVKITFNII
jgi:hypothetical protein